VAEDDRVRVREAGPETVQGERLRQLAAKSRAVDVAVDGGHRPELAQLGEHRWLAEVAGVDD
jgi:hypothetical protein